MVDPVSIAMALAQFAPSIIKWVSGSDKAELAAATVVDIAQKVTGKSDGVSALATITASAEAKMAFRRELMAHEADLDKAYLVDRQDARKRDVALQLAGKTNSRANWLIVGDVVGLIVCLCVITFLPELPGEVRGIISTIAAAFALGLRDAHQYEFGSSRGSAEKSEQIAQLTK